MIRSPSGHFFATAAIAIIFLTSIMLTANRVAAEPKAEFPRSVAADKATEQGEKRELVSLEVARGQARILHEVMHATLLIVHHQYYREDEGLPIPSRTLEDVFDEIARRENIEFRWIAVNALAMNIDHQPQDSFEKQAVKELLSGKERFEQVENGVYRHAGPITLFSQCLKCHLPKRTSTKNRTAGLVITIPFKKN